jgi:hypothetical protein
MEPGGPVGGVVPGGDVAGLGVARVVAADSGDPGVAEDPAVLIHDSLYRSAGRNLIASAAPVPVPQPRDELNQALASA